MSEFHHFQVGDFKCVTLNDGKIIRDAMTFFLHAPEAELRPALIAHDMDFDAVPTWFDPLYIDTGSNKVIVDTGNGPERGGELFQTMESAGIKPQDIDTVILTHAHVDHIGGNTMPDGTIAFPNARYYMWRGEWEAWTAEDFLRSAPERVPMITKNLLNIQSRFTLVDSETDIVPGIQAVTAPGHSPGHMALLINRQMLHIGDALHQPLHAEYPTWSAKFDYSPDIAPVTRRKLMQMAVADHLTVYGFHFPFPGYGQVTPQGDTWVWQQKGSQ